MCLTGGIAERGCFTDWYTTAIFKLETRVNQGESTQWIAYEVVKTSG